MLWDCRTWVGTSTRCWTTPSSTTTIWGLGKPWWMAWSMYALFFMFSLLYLFSLYFSLFLTFPLFLSFFNHDDMGTWDTMMDGMVNVRTLFQYYSLFFSSLFSLLIKLSLPKLFFSFPATIIVFIFFSFSPVILFFFFSFCVSPFLCLSSFLCLSVFLSFNLSLSFSLLVRSSSSRRRTSSWSTTRSTAPTPGSIPSSTTEKLHSGTSYSQVREDVKKNLIFVDQFL